VQKSHEMTNIPEILSKAENLLHSNELKEAENLLSSINGEEEPGFWFLKGLLNQKTHQWGKAINYYNKCLDLDPSHPKAAAGIEICRSILNFWNPSLYNP
jgi:hypothetical protein